MRYVLASAVVMLVLWATTRYYGQRPHTFTEVIVDMTISIDEVKRIIGERLEPAFVAAATAMRDIAAAYPSTLAEAVEKITGVGHEET